MFNTVNGNGTTVAEKLGIDSEVRELKFGPSFNSGNRGQQGAFHTIRYDFKPASVDRSKTATMEVGPSGQVTISMPHHDTGTTVFKGPTRPYTKECVLIIDKDTGEFVIEKLNHNVQVKKTRQERPEGATRNSSKSNVAPSVEGRPSSLSIQSENIQKSPAKDDKIKRHSSSNSSSSHQHPHSLNTSSVRRRPNSPMTSVAPTRHSPVGPPPGPNSPSNNLGASQGSAPNTFDSIVNSKHQQHHPSTQSFMPSLTSIEDLLITPPIHAPTPVATTVKAPVPKTNSSVSGAKSHKGTTHEVGNAESESSSGDSSSSSSSDDDDDESSSISDMEEVMPDKVPIPPLANREKSSVPPVTMTMSMPSFLSLGYSAAKPAAPTVSMPSHLLSEDLQLSESGSDSD